MKLLFDQGTAAPFRGHFPAHSAVTLADKSWSEKGNSEWFYVAERGGYSVFVTTDQRLPYQQSLMGRRIALSFRSPQPWNLLGGSDEAEPR